jgi:hypothetical protein
LSILPNSPAPNVGDRGDSLLVMGTLKQRA